MPTAPALLRAGLLSAAALTFHPASPAQAAPKPLHAEAALGPVSPGTPVHANVYLKLHNKADLDASVQEMYSPGAARFHRFGAVGDIRRYAPTDAEVAAVKKELTAHNLKIVATDPMNLSVRIAGTSADIESAFHTTIAQFKAQSGTVLTAMSGAPALGGAASGLVAAVTGVGAHKMQLHAVRPIDPQTGKARAAVPLSAVAPDGAFASAQCFYPASIHTFISNGVTAAYGGLNFGANPANTLPGTLPPCGYSPQDVYRLFGLNSVYGRGYTGRGQTIAIVDAYTAPTIQQDLATFDSIYGLPDPNFQVLTPTPVTEADAGAVGETTLDVEWAHAIAPEAAIALVLAPSLLDTDLENALLYIIENGTADIISNSYGSPELATDPQGVTTFDEIAELAAFVGIDVNFSSGDSGDFAAQENGQTDVSTPADSPYVTAVGGVSAASTPSGNGVIQTGWGNNITRVNSRAGGVDNPPQLRGFVFGAGGGTSQYFAKPAFQSALQGTGRLVPDVAQIADPFTGVEIILTVDGQPSYEVIGGTSVASPVFSAEWALLQQGLGVGLGQAAPLISQYGTNPSFVTDVLPVSAATAAADDVTGRIRDNTTRVLTTFSASDLIQPGNGNRFLSAVYTSTAGSTFDLSFGTDSSLAVTRGYDFVTGWGVLNLPGIFNLLAK